MKIWDHKLTYVIIIFISEMAPKKAAAAKPEAAKGVKKVRTSVKFYRPKTFRCPRAPKYPRYKTKIICLYYVNLNQSLFSS